MSVVVLRRALAGDHRLLTLVNLDLFNAAFGIGSAGFSDGTTCCEPLYLNRHSPHLVRRRSSGPAHRSCTHGRVTMGLTAPPPASSATPETVSVLIGLEITTSIGPVRRGEAQTGGCADVRGRRHAGRSGGGRAAGVAGSCAVGQPLPGAVERAVVRVASRNPVGGVGVALVIASSGRSSKSGQNGAPMKEELGLQSSFKPLMIVATHPRAAVPRVSWQRPSAGPSGTCTRTCGPPRGADRGRFGVLIVELEAKVGTKVLEDGLDRWSARHVSMASAPICAQATMGWGTRQRTQPTTVATAGETERGGITPGVRCDWVPSNFAERHEELPLIAVAPVDDRDAVEVAGGQGLERLVVRRRRRRL